jgi:hypothetical protein
MTNEQHVSLNYDSFRTKHTSCNVRLWYIDNSGKNIHGNNQIRMIVQYDKYIQFDDQTNHSRSKKTTSTVLLMIFIEQEFEIKQRLQTTTDNMNK